MVISLGVYAVVAVFMIPVILIAGIAVGPW